MRSQQVDDGEHGRESRAEQRPDRVSVASCESACRIRSSVRAPKPERVRSCSASAAVRRSATVVIPSSFQILAADFGPSPGRRMKLTTSGGTIALRFVKACISPSSTIWTIFSSIVLPIPRKLLGGAVQRELATGRVSPDPRGRAAVRITERRLALELQQVGEQLQLLRHFLVLRQRVRHEQRS